MGRLVQLAPRPSASLSGGPSPEEKSTEDDFATRLAKYVPVEIAGPFPIIDNALTEYVAGRNDRLATALTWAVFLLLFLFNLAYLYRRAAKEYPDAAIRATALRYHLLFSSIAFVLWTYIINATLWHAVYSPLLATIASGLFVVGVASVTPVEPKSQSGT